MTDQGELILGNIFRHSSDYCEHCPKARDFYDRRKNRDKVTKQRIREEDISKHRMINDDHPSMRQALESQFLNSSSQESTKPRPRIAAELSKKRRSTPLPYLARAQRRWIDD